MTRRAAPRRSAALLLPAWALATLLAGATPLAAAPPASPPPPAAVPVEVVPDAASPPVAPAPEPSPAKGTVGAPPPAAAASAVPPPSSPSLDGVRSLVREGRYEEAGAALAPLLAAAPGDAELLALRGRVLAGEQRFDEALQAFRGSLAAREDGEVRREMERARAASVLRTADRLAAEGKEAEAAALLEAEHSAGTDRYETGRRLGRLYLRRRDFPRAADHYREMASRYPDELDLRASRIEALLLAGETETARAEADALPPADREALRVGREDLFYRMAGNSARLLGSFASVDRGRPDEDRLEALGTFRVRGGTIEAGAATVSRFRDRDSRLAFGLKAPVWEGNDAWGALSLSLSPSADFLPRWSAGVETGTSLRRHDLSAGYVHHHFGPADAGIVSGEATAWLPVDAAVSQRASVALSTRAWSSLTTLRYEPDHALRIFGSLSFGTLAERPEALPDLERRFGYAERGGVEWRPKAERSYGGELFHEHREREGHRLGLSLFARYWW